MNIMEKYGRITINELNIQGRDFKDRVLTSETLSITRHIYNTTIQCSIVLKPHESADINPGSIVYADIDYGESNYKFYTMVDTMDINAEGLATSDPFIIYNIETISLDSILARRTIYGNVYSIISPDGRTLTMPIIQKDMRKLSDIDALLDIGDKDNIRKIQGWEKMVDSTDLENMVIADIEDEYYIKLKNEVKNKYKISKDNYINIKYSKNSDSLMAGDVVKDYASRHLVEENISLGRIDDGVDIWETSIEDFDTVSLKHVMDELANASGYVWFINDKRELNFFKELSPAGNYKETIKKDNLSDFILKSMNKTIQGYYNKVFVRGGEPYEDMGEDMLDMSGNIKFIKELPVEIQKQKEITGMSGVHGTTHINNMIHTMKDAEGLANNLLGKAGRLPNKLVISTHKTHLDILDKVKIDLPELNMVGDAVVTNIHIDWIMRSNGEEKAETIIQLEPISMLSNLREDWALFMDKLVMNVNNLGKTVTQIKNGAPSGGNSLDYSLTDSPIIADQGDPDIPIDPDPEPGDIPPAPGRVNDFHLDFTKKGTIVGGDQVLNSFNKTQLAGFLSGEIIDETEDSHSYVKNGGVNLSSYYREIPIGTFFAVIDLEKGVSSFDISGKQHIRDIKDFDFLSPERYRTIYSSEIKTPEYYPFGSPSGFKFYSYYNDRNRYLYQSIYDYANLYHNGEYVPSIPGLKRQHGFQIIGFNSGKAIDSSTAIVAAPQIWHCLKSIKTTWGDARLYEVVAYNRVLTKEQYAQTYNYLCRKYNKKEWVI